MVITLNNYEWKVIFVPGYDRMLENEDKDFMTLGRTHYDKLLIAINKDLPERLQDESIIHELMHAYLFSVGMRDEMMNNEELCTFIGCNFKTILEVYEQIKKGMKHNG